MNVSFLYVNVIAFLCFALMLIAFCATEKSREMRSWIALLAVLTSWAAGSLCMRLNIFPNYRFWYYVSIMSLFSIPFLAYNYVCRFANVQVTKQWIVWLTGTIIILLITPTGIFLPPPEVSANASGSTVFTYTMDWKIGIPLVFLLFIVWSIFVAFKKILAERGTHAPGVVEVIIGNLMLCVGNMAQILPGNTFPWDTLSGIIFAVMIVASQYKRRMFNSSLIISSGILTAVSGLMCVAASIYFFPSLNLFFEKYGGNIAAPETETFILLSVLLIAIIFAFKKLLGTIFSEQQHQENTIKKFSDSVSKTLIIDDILRETSKVIRSEININQLYICLLNNDKYVPVYSAMPLKPLEFCISADHPCVKYFENGENHIVLKEFETNPLYKSAWGEEKNLFEEKDTSCLLALRDGDKVTGIIMLANKEKGNDYTYNDFSFLNTVCSIASIALRNADLYKRVSERDRLFNNMSGFINTVILIKPKGKACFNFVSANTEKILGLKQEFFSARTPMQVLAECIEEDRYSEIFENLKTLSKDGYTCDCKFVSPADCREMVARCTFMPIYFNDTVTHYVCTVNDITADIEAQELLKNSVEIAQNSSEAKGQFLSHMSHEIRTPMNSIAGITYLAKEAAQSSGESDMLDYLNQIDQSTQYLLSLLNDIMDMSKIESRKFEIHKAPFNIVTVLDEVYAVYSSQMLSKGVQFSLDFDNIKYENIMGDELSLRKILNNLLSNAYKFTPAGGEVKLLVSQRITVDNSAAMHFEVSDTGIGMSPDFIEKIFVPYSQETSTNRKTNGSGLGMAICKSMVDMQSGRISVESTQGKGTCFTVDISYSLSETDAKKAGVAVDCSQLKDKRIMVVDDVMINTVITQRLLENKGVIVECADNGRKALDLFLSRNDYYYDCILMDIQMPVMDGIEATAKIRAANKRYAATVPIIAMTADVFVPDKDGENSDFNSFIIKPLSPDEMYAKLVDILLNK